MMNEIANPMTLEALTESIRTAVRLQDYAGGEHEIAEAMRMHPHSPCLRISTSFST